MADLVHKYFCTHCTLYIFGETLVHLAGNVNFHAIAHHPADFSNWTAANIESSTQYSKAAGPLPQYLAVHGTTSQRTSILPEITDADRAMLAEAHIKW